MSRSGSPSSSPPRSRTCGIPTFTQQSLLTMVRQRIYGILADYEDQNDHDTLRSDPIFKMIADRLPDDPDLASQPTLSRFENAVSIADLWRLRDVLVDVFIQSFDAAAGAPHARPRRLRRPGARRPATDHVSRIL